MYTMKDIAQMAGVSPSTVSRVINGTKQVNEETRQRVNEIINELNYSPDPLAKAMRTQKSNFIGVVVSDIADPFFSELYSVIWKSLSKFGYNALLLNIPLDYGSNEEKDILYNLSYWNMEGVIFCFNGELSKRDERFLNGKRSISFVRIEHSMGKNDKEGVLVDTGEGMYRAVKYFINQGQKTIAFFGGKKEWYSTINGWPDPRLQAYQRALYEAGIEYDENLIFNCDLNVNGGQAAAEQLLSLKNRPSAIVTVNDSIACGAIKIFLKNGIKIPQDISIFGFDDNLLAKTSSPELSTVRVPVNLIGESAAKMLVDKLEGKSKKIYKHTISTDLIIRETTK